MDVLPVLVVQVPDDFCVFDTDAFDNSVLHLLVLLDLTDDTF